MKREISCYPFPEGTDIGIVEMSITYLQEADCLSDKDEVQHLTVTARCDVPEKDHPEDSWWVDISIPDGEHWSVCHPDELVGIINDFKERLKKKTIIEIKETI